ncbi:MAG: YhfZ family protein, partial [Angelakisella sp.]
TFLEKHSELEIAMTLSHCLYSHEYVLCINRPDATGLEDGMVLACDPNCADQVTLIAKLARDKKIVIKNTPYTACRAALLNYEVDGMVYRHEEWLDNFTSVKKIPLTDEQYTQRDMNTPVLLVNKNNYGIKKLLQYMLDEDKIHQVQQLVLDKKMQAQYY